MLHELVHGPQVGISLLQLNGLASYPAAQLERFSLPRQEQKLRMQTCQMTVIGLADHLWGQERGIMRNQW